ncbi:MAG TPA: T9SS type A sorting domain-containing protein, partial [Bacteroides sp.]|nr:T9SS type A sorting domain-containing protein [Bacteroides sp.]
NESLVIEAGVVVDFEGHFRFTIHGELTALGATNDSIRFTRVTNDPAMLPDSAGLADTSNYTGSWAGIEYQTWTSSVSNFSHCIFEFISTVDNTGIPYNSHKAPFHFGGDGYMYMTHSVIRNNLGTNCGGIYTSDHAFIDSCMVRDNIAYGTDNFSVQTAGGIYIYSSEDGEVTNSMIINNRAYGHSAGGGIKIYAGSPLIINNFISNNRSFQNTVSGGGIMCGSSYPRIIQNLIVNNECSSAGGIYYQAGGGKLYNNTICNNLSHRSDGAGLRFEGSSGTIATNNILYGNENSIGLAQISLSSMSSQPVVKYNLIGMGMGEIVGQDNGAIMESDNLFGNPSIFNPTAFTGNGILSKPEDWYLSDNSFLINEGNVEPINQFSIEKDMAGNRRINYGHVDPGCFEFRVESYTPAATISSPEVWIADTVHITKETRLNAKVTIYPGVVILSDGNHNIYAWDSLYAIGTANAPILFTIKDTAGFSNAASDSGGWGHIDCQGFDPRVFKHCVFEFGKVYRTIDEERGLITGRSNGNVHVEKCVFRNCHMIHSSLVYTFSGPNYIVKGCTFYNNKITSTAGLIMLVNGSNYLVRDNLIYNNDCEQRIVSLGGANIDFINNSIYHNNGQVTMGTCFNINCVNNTIVNNSSGASIWTGDNARIINSIIPELSISQEGYEIISSYVPANLCTGDKCTDLLTEAPVFNNPLPYSGIGPMEEILLADYSLSNVSPGINFGATDTAGLKLSSLDLTGNQRINDGRIDIGAYENQGSLPEITSQPVGGTFCLGEDHVLEVEYDGSDTVTFKWFKDGAYVVGQDKDKTLELDSILTVDEGNYHCEINNSYGKVLSTTVYIKVNVKPDILVQPEDTWHESGKSLSFHIVYTGSSPITFQWEKDGELIPGEELPEYRFTPADSSHEGNYTCTVTNACGVAETEPAAVYLSPQICMVTVSSTTGHNLVVWEKKSKAPIMAYRIYRESIAAGIYDRLTTIAYDELSVFVDTNADPTVQAYLYKITALDTANNETDIDLCRPHKTIHLLVTTNPELNTTQLSWDRYYGFEYQTYTIYRSSTGVNFDPVHSLSASLNSWTDPSPTTGDLFYRMAVEKPDPCVPEGGGKKAGTGPYQHSLSNMDNNKLKAGENPPDSIMLGNHTIDENLLPGSLVGRLTTRDVDTLDYYTYHLVSGDGDDDNSSFSLIGDLLVSATTFDYETKSTLSVRIRTTDNAAFYLEKAFTITINDTGEESGSTTGSTPPDTVKLDNNSILENNLFGDLVGRFGTVDKDTFDVHTYHLVSGTGDDDNGLFMILGDMLMAAFKFDFEMKNQYMIRVRATDLGSNHIEESFIINIVDVNEPALGMTSVNTGSVNAYPNPFSHATTIRFHNPSNETYKLILMDLSGKVYRIVDNVTTSQYVLKRETLRKGLYLLELRGPETYRTKLVIE